MRSTFSLLPYINRSKVRADGTTAVLCRITIDGKQTAISTGIYCRPEDWNGRKNEIKTIRENNRLSELMEVSDRCAIKTTPNEKIDFSALLSYGNEAIMLEKLITETEKEMQAVRDAAKEKDLQKLDALTHHLRSSWEILRADQPLRVLYRVLHNGVTPDDNTIQQAVNSVLDRGAEIVQQAKEERRKYENG